jgi:hypothetical protein
MVYFRPAPILSAHWITSFRTPHLHDLAILICRCQGSNILDERSAVCRTPNAARPHQYRNLIALIPSNLRTTLQQGQNPETLLQRLNPYFIAICKQRNDLIEEVRYNSHSP